MKKGSCMTVLLFLFFLGGCMQCPSFADIPQNEHQTVTIPRDEDGGGFAATSGNTAKPADDALVVIKQYIPGIEVEQQYGTVNNFTKQRLYDFSDAYLRYGTVKKLKKASEMLKAQGLGLKVWDAFRPVSAQVRLYNAHPDPNVVSHPVTGYRGHCRGNAVDVTLVDLATGKELAMPTGFDNFTPYADRDYSDCGAAAAANARLLESIMTKCGFIPLQSEWWHFTDGDTYPVDESFDPGTPGVWAANCNEYISLSSSAHGSRSISSRATPQDTPIVIPLSEKTKKETERPPKMGSIEKYAPIVGSGRICQRISTQMHGERETYKQMVIYGGMQRISSFTIRFLGWMI